MTQDIDGLSLDITNAGFEHPILAIEGAFTGGYAQGDPIPGWQLYDPNGLSTLYPDAGALNPLPAEFPDGIPAGDNVGYTFAFTPVGSGVIGLAQTLSATLTANTRYILQVEVGNIADGNLADAIELNGFPGYRVELLADGTRLAADDNTLSIAEGEFKTATLTFVASADLATLGKPLEIRLLNLIQDVGLEVDFDQVRLTAETVSIVGSGLTGQQSFAIDRGSGISVIDDFGGVVQDSLPVSQTIAEVDVMQLQGEGLTASNMLLAQVGTDLEISFDGITDTKIVLTDFALENLDNLPRHQGASLGNIRFNGQSALKDSFDVVEENWNATRLLNRNSVTFLNALDNTVSGFKNSNDVINGQNGNDTIKGDGGDDLLRGGGQNDRLWGEKGEDTLIGDSGDDWLTGGEGRDTLTGGTGSDTFVLSDKNGGDRITDFEDGIDRLSLVGKLTIDQLTIMPGTGMQSSDTLIATAATGKLLATLTGIPANLISIADFTQSHH